MAEGTGEKESVVEGAAAGPNVAGGPAPEAHRGAVAKTREDTGSGSTSDSTGWPSAWTG